MRKNINIWIINQIRDVGNLQGLEMHFVISGSVNSKSYQLVHFYYKEIDFYLILKFFHMKLMIVLNEYV